MPPPRPYFSKSAVELRAIFAANRSNKDVLHSLAAELRSRAVPKARALAEEVRAALVSLEPTRQTTTAPPHSPGPPQPSSTNGAKIEPQVPPTKSTDNANANKSPKPNTEAPPMDLGSLPTTTRPIKANEPLAILAAWTALEALSPQTYRLPQDLAAGDRSCVEDLSGDSIPWGKGTSSRKNYKLFYQIILGSIAMDRATDDLVKAFGQDEERSRREKEKAAIAAILIDKDGFVLEQNAIAISSFAWALPLSLHMKLGNLGEWPRVEGMLQEKLDGIVRRTDGNGAPIPLDLPTVMRAWSWLVAQLHLPEHLVERPTFALRVFHYYKSKTPPEASLLNSFYLTDLTQAATLVTTQTAGTGLRRYLGIETIPDALDVLNPKTAVEPLVAPLKTPVVRWPSPGGHPLVLLQQAAVNAARGELAPSSGIMGVNGPPGTGKTTLLRDVVAACVFDRALAMAAFDDPNLAFTSTGHKMAMGEKAFFNFYKLDGKLRGHEVIVASSNNNAVENVSRELPIASAVGRDISYFRSISDLVANPERAGFSNLQDAEQRDPFKTWGLISAALGNAKNRASFQQIFWWHENGFRTYLKAAKGDSVVQEIKDPVTGRVIERRIPDVVTQENPPPSAIAAAAAWRKARARFMALKADIEKALTDLEKDRQNCLRLPKERAAFAVLVQEQTHLSNLLATLSHEHEACQQTATQLESVLRSRTDARLQHRRARPGFFNRLLRTKKWLSWKRHDAALSDVETTARHNFESANQARMAARQGLDEETAQFTILERKVGEQRAVVEKIEAVVDKVRCALGERVIDDSFFEQPHEKIHLTSPWLPDSLHRQREELFGAALEVHKAFVDSAAQKVLHNLSILMSAMTAGAIPDPAKRSLLGDLWSTLFLVIPVISTTFASVNRMFGDLPAESFGWLLIDEAGQAIPQAAVGAIMRAKRSVVVGDPMQIPPVVSLPERLNTEICAFFKVDRPIWAAPQASSQSLADAASFVRSFFSSDTGQRQVGMPLLVHRRCQEPMFGISNRIAYDRQMVQAVGPKKPGEVGEIFGPPRWINVDGEASSKWCPDEGEATIDLLKSLIGTDVRSPDIFIITPFKIVEQEMRRRLAREDEMFHGFGASSEEWAKSRVGTVHTFQGREAETVILLLGAPMVNQNGARTWAGTDPNILNVAVSRAKQNLYVIGSVGAWSGVGYFRELARSLPTETIKVSGTSGAR